MSSFHSEAQDLIFILSFYRVPLTNRILSCAGGIIRGEATVLLGFQSIPQPWQLLA
jgi:hypothetical protein